MTKKEAIKELRDLIETTCYQKGCWNVKDCNLCMARTIISEGYRKLPYYNDKSETITISKEMFQKLLQGLKP